MNAKINKILILFCFMLVILFVMTWEILQSQWVASKVSVITSSYVAKVLDSKIEFEKLEFDLFPPGAKLKTVKFIGKQNGVSLDLTAGYVGVQFNPLDIFSTKFTVGKVTLKDSVVKVNMKNGPKKKGEVEKIKMSPLDVFEHLNEIPIKEPWMLYNAQF